MEVKDITREIVVQTRVQTNSIMQTCSTRDLGTSDLSTNMLDLVQIGQVRIVKVKGDLFLRISQTKRLRSRGEQ